MTTSETTTIEIRHKVNHLLEVKQIPAKKLAEHLKVSPQTVSDLRKGRSNCTLSHLRGLISFFGLCANYWLDTTRVMPTPEDATKP